MVTTHSTLELITRRSEQKEPLEATAPDHPVDVSIRMYQEAVIFYANHPNQDLHKSYQTSLAICQQLKHAFELSSQVSAEIRKLKPKHMSHAERQERLSMLVIKRLRALEDIHASRSQLKLLKQQRATKSQ